MSYIRVDDMLMARDFAGRRAMNTVFGETIVGSREDDISVQFQYSNSARDVTAAVSGSGATSNSTQQAVVSITGAVGSAKLTSMDSVRYRPGHETTAQFTSVYVGAQAGVAQSHGVFNATNGIGFGTENGIFGVWILDGGVKTFTPQSSFNGDKLDGTGESGFTIDITKMNIYMVNYGWLGIAPIIFSVYTGHITGWRVAHVIDLVNIDAVPHIRNPTLPIAVEVVRTSGSGSAASVRTSSWRAGVVAGDSELNSANRWFAYTSFEFVIAASTRHNVFTLRNKTTYQGVTNHVVVELGVVAFDNSTVKTIAVYGTKGATLTGASAYADINTADSVMEVSTGGTVTLGTRGPATVLQKDSSARTDVRGTGILIYPGEAFTFELVTGSAASGNVSISARWVERF